MPVRRHRHRDLRGRGRRGPGRHADPHDRDTGPRTPVPMSARSRPRTRHLASPPSTGRRRRPHRGGPAAREAVLVGLRREADRRRRSAAPASSRTTRTAPPPPEAGPPGEAVKPVRHGGLEIGRHAEEVLSARAAVLAKPPVRRLAKDLGVDLAVVDPTGAGGVITRADVERRPCCTASVHDRRRTAAPRARRGLRRDARARCGPRSRASRR